MYPRDRCVVVVAKVDILDLSNRAKSVLWERKKIPACLAEAQSWQWVAESHELLSILCGSAWWKNWFDFNIAVCLNCSSVKCTERLIEAMKAFYTLKISATPNSVWHHGAKQLLKEHAAWITTVKQKSANMWGFFPSCLSYEFTKKKWRATDPALLCTALAGEGGIQLKKSLRISGVSRSKISELGKMQGNQDFFTIKQINSVQQHMKGKEMLFVFHIAESFTSYILHTWNPCEDPH